MVSFRLDRLLTLYFFSPLLRIRSSNKEPRIPILMYHSISGDNEDNIHPYYHINTSPSVFAMHMQFLHENSYTVISLSEAVRILKSSDTNFCDDLTNKLNKPFPCWEPKLSDRGNKPNAPQRYVVLTFDDGYRDFYTKAFPILQRYGYTATVFLPTALIGNTKHKLKGKDHLNWDEVKELSEKGISFGSHTVNHPQLKNIDYSKIEYELRRSKERIKTMLGREINLFSYPYKFPEEDKKFIKYLKEILVKFGYECNVTTKIGSMTPQNDCFFLKRLPMNSSDDLQFFNVKLDGSYDWLYHVQRFAKKITRLIPKTKTFRS